MALKLLNVSSAKNRFAEHMNVFSVCSRLRAGRSIRDCNYGSLWDTICSLKAATTLEASDIEGVHTRSVSKPPQTTLIKSE